MFCPFRSRPGETSQNMTQIDKLFKFGSQLVAIGLDTTLYLTGPKGIPAWGIGPTLVLLFPEKH